MINKHAFIDDIKTDKCERCDKAIVKIRHNQKYCKDCQPIARLENMRLRYNTPEYKERAKMREQTTECKETRKRYRMSSKRKLVQKKYRQSNKNIVCQKKYNTSDKGKLVQRRAWRKYKDSLKGKAYTKAYNSLHPERSRRGSIKILYNINKEELLKTFGYQCAYYGINPGCCGKHLKNDKYTHIDHLYPVSRCNKIGKQCEHSFKNCVPSCVVCNISKNDKLPLEFIIKQIK